MSIWHRGDSCAFCLELATDRNSFSYNTVMHNVIKLSVLQWSPLTPLAIVPRNNITAKDQDQEGHVLCAWHFRIPSFTRLQGWVTTVPAVQGNIALNVQLVLAEDETNSSLGTCSCSWTSGLRSVKFIIIPEEYELSSFRRFVVSECLTFTASYGQHRLSLPLRIWHANINKETQAQKYIVADKPFTLGSWSEC